MIKVVIVEDDPMVADINKRYVESNEQFKVVGIINNGKDALEYIIKNEVHLIILDIYMPKMDGISLLKEIKRNQIKCDVIFVTAAKESKEIDTALKLGAIDYLIKPFDGNRIKKALNNYLIRYNLIQNKEVFQQEDIDKITGNFFSTNSEEIEKGLHKNTLKVIRNFLQNKEGIYLTAKDVSDSTKLSSVTVRRYLDYLVSEGELDTKVEYGTIGRPCVLYRTT